MAGDHHATNPQLAAAAAPLQHCSIVPIAEHGGAACYWHVDNAVQCLLLPELPRAALTPGLAPSGDAFSS
jgi:hypothetical protein